MSAGRGHAVFGPILDAVCPAQSAGKVEVLRLLDRACREQPQLELTPVRAAVAELIEADNEWDAANEAIAAEYSAGDTISTDHPLAVRIMEAGARRRAALARVQP